MSTLSMRIAYNPLALAQSKFNFDSFTRTSHKTYSHILHKKDNAKNATCTIQNPVFRLKTYRTAQIMCVFKLHNRGDCHG